MTKICFVSPCKPIMCGIADYTGFVANHLPPSKWAALSFDPQKYGAPLVGDGQARANQIWYGLSPHNRFSASILRKGLEWLGYRHNHATLWFQHEFGIWPDQQKFVSMLNDLAETKVVSLHTLHFQSQETHSGLRASEYELLRAMLPYVEAITVFSHGVYRAVTSAFPEHRAKVYVIKHGIHSYPDVARMSRKEAKEKLNDFLLYESGLSQNVRNALHNQRIFLDPRITVIGQTGFLCPLKDSGLLYRVRDRMQKDIPSKRIVAVRIGPPRDTTQEAYAEELRQQQNCTDKFILKTWLPPDMLPVSQKAFDINWFWPKDCTQSGIVAHALGAGAIIAGRDFEGAGETFKEAGAINATRPRQLARKMRGLILNPGLCETLEEKALKYAARYSWENQARAHSILAKRLLQVHAKNPIVHPTSQSMPLALDVLLHDMIAEPPMTTSAR